MAVPKIEPGKTRIGWIGTGVMGSSMVGHLMQSGFKATVYTRTQVRAESVLDQGAEWAASPKAVAEVSDVVFSIVGFPEDVREVMLGEHGALAGAKPGTILVDMTTSDPSLAAEIYEAAKAKGCYAVDAPVSGGDVGARAGTLSIMIGGSEEAFQRAQPLFQVMGEKIVHIGGPGSGQVTKACNQMVVALTLEAVGEALVLAKKSGVDPAKVRDALLGGFAQSRILDVHGKRALEQRFEPGFRLRLHDKDLSIALEAASEVGSFAPTTTVVGELLHHLSSGGQGDMDHSYLIEEVARRSDTHL